MNIRSYAQCVAPNGTHLLPFQKIVNLYAPHLKVGRPPKWFTYLVNGITEAQSSVTTLTLRPKFYIPVADTLNRESTNSVATYHFSTSDIRKAWLVTNLPATKVAFGRLNATQPSTPQLILTHWMPTTSFLDRPTNTQIRRPHNLRLTPCPGCSLNDISIGPLHRRIHPNRKKSWSCVFACSKANTIRITDGLHNPANNIATFPQPAAQYEFAAQLNTTDTAILPYTITAPIAIPSNELPVSNKLSAIYRKPLVITSLLPLTLKLELTTNRNY